MQVDGSGRVHVAFETAVSPTRQGIVEYTSTDGGSTWTRRVGAYVTDIPNPLAGAAFRTDSFPSLAVDGSTVHLVWANAVKVGGNVYARLLYMRSTNSGASWSSPALLASGSGDDWFPAVAARGGKVYVSWLHRGSANATYTARAVASSDGGATWSAPLTISGASSTVPLQSLSRLSHTSVPPGWAALWPSSQSARPPRGQDGSPDPLATYIAEETATLRRQRVTLSESQPSLLDAASIGR